MQKVLVAEIGSERTVVNAFGNLDTGNPRLLGQGLSQTTALEGDIEIGVKLAVTDLEKEIGPIGSLDKTPFYAISSLPTNSVFKDDKGPYSLNGKILPTPEAIGQAAKLIYEEVGDVLVLDVEGTSTSVYSITSESWVQRTIEEDLGVSLNAMSIVKLIGENKIKEHHGQGWEKLLTPKPETPEQIAFSAELIAGAITIALQRHSKRLYNYYETRMSGNVPNAEGQNLTGIRWIIGTGVALTQLPNALDIMMESIMEMEDTVVPKEGIAIMLDKDCIMASLGVLTKNFRLGAWQLLRESFGVEN